jgi:hypothetical protein
MIPSAPMIQNMSNPRRASRERRRGKEGEAMVAVMKIEI